MDPWTLLLGRLSFVFTLVDRLAQLGWSDLPRAQSGHKTHTTYASWLERSTHGAMRLALAAVGLLASLADARTWPRDIRGRHCHDAIVNEALVSFDDYACVTDMKSCIGAGTCMAAGIAERRLCECYLQAGRSTGS